MSAVHSLIASADEPGHCASCHGPIEARTKLGMIRDYVCYVAVLHCPARYWMSGPMRAILPYAGTHAYTCGCWHKIVAAEGGVA